MTNKKVVARCDYCGAVTYTEGNFFTNENGTFCCNNCWQHAIDGDDFDENEDVEDEDIW